MQLELELWKMQQELDQLLAVLRHVRKDRPGYFNPAERIRIHQRRAALMRALEDLAAYQPKEPPPGAAKAVLSLANEKRITGNLEKKITDILKWMVISVQ